MYLCVWGESLLADFPFYCRWLLLIYTPTFLPPADSDWYACLETHTHRHTFSSWQTPGGLIALPYVRIVCLSSWQLTNIVTVLDTNAQQQHSAHAWLAGRMTAVWITCLSFMSEPGLSVWIAGFRQLGDFITSHFLTLYCCALSVGLFISSSHDFRCTNSSCWMLQPLIDILTLTLQCSSLTHKVSNGSLNKTAIHLFIRGGWHCQHQTFSSTLFCDVS